MKSGIYKIVNITDGKIYIGSSINIRDRIARHKRDLNSGTHHNIKLLNCWGKYGAAYFTFEIVLICSKENLIMYEQKCIDLYNCVATGYNICTKAESPLGIKRSEEFKKKLSIAATGKRHSFETREKMRNRCISEEIRKKISERQIGKEVSAETRKKISSAMRGKLLSDDHKRKLSIAHTGRKISEETRHKLSKAGMNRRHSDESKKKMSEARKLYFINIKNTDRLIK